MEFRQLKTFQKTAATLSFSAAAEALNYAQSTVSSQIQSLEQDLGVQLFDRLGKQIALTDAGRRFLGYAEQILSLAEEAQLAITGSEVPAGTLRIGAPESLCVYRLPPVLRRYRESYSQVRLVLQPGACPDLRSATRSGATDVTFTLEPPVQSEELHVEVLRTEPLRIVAHPEHPLARRARVYPKDLENEPLLMTEATCSYRRMFEERLERADVCPVATHEFNSVEAIKQCVMAGMGVAILPGVSVAREVADGEIAALAWADEQLSVVMQMVWHKEKWISPAMREFLQMARAMLREET